MKCEACKSKAHIICGLKLDCPCCQKTLNEIWQENEEAYKLLLKRLVRKNVKAKTQELNTGSGENRNPKEAPN